MRFQHAALALYRVLKIVRDRFLEEHNVAVRGRIVCVFDVYRRRDGGLCVCVCVCSRARALTCMYMCTCNCLQR